MKINRSFPFLLLALFVWPAFAGLSFSQNQVEVVIPPGCNHVPIYFPYEMEDGVQDESGITVSSDSSWAIPAVNTDLNRIEVNFSSQSLIASYTATLLVDDGESTTELFVQASVSPLDVYRLEDDPLRSKTYGIQSNGINKGSLFAFDPVQESFLSCITLGKHPTDFVINDDSSELLVINSVDETIDVIDLDSFALKETIALPSYSHWGDEGETSANIELGPEGIIYYSDGSWGPVLHVLNRATGNLVQSLIFDGSAPSHETGFMDFAVTGDKTKMVALPQYGWSAGVHYRTLGQYDIHSDGTITAVKTATVSDLEREPFESPVLLSDDDQTAVMKTISTDPANIDNLGRVFSNVIWSMNPSGNVVATEDKLYDYKTGKELYSIPVGNTYNSGYLYTKAQAFTSDFTRFVYFDASVRALKVINLIEAIGLDQLGRSLSPANGSVVNSPSSLTWTPLSGVDQYDLYLGTNEDTVTTASPSSPSYLGRVNGSSFELLQTLNNGVEYFWRIDPVTSEGPETGTLYSFTVSDIALSKTQIEAATVVGHSNYKVEIDLSSEQSGLEWSASPKDTWLSLVETSGTTPSTLTLHLNASNLEPGFHNSHITLTTDSGELKIPVELEVEPLAITHLRSDRDSTTVYAISEDTSTTISTAYLLEIDSEQEKIVRVTPVGSSVTDMAIHYTDQLLYITNWKSGELRVLDKNSLEHVKSHAFVPAGATGYSYGDVYRVAAGASQRLVVEEEDQWIDISLYNTNTESSESEAHVREGGGVFGPNGRYYYHGENNSSGASIMKFDTSGDSFTLQTEVRPTEISNYYGSRTVVISEDGSRVFWAGVALDQDLNTEWGIGETIYSTSGNGRYAFAETAIYDINLRRQILAMPVSSKISGYNSTSQKLILPINNSLGFYELTPSAELPAPVLSIGTSSDDSIELSWTDSSLEMEFLIQQRLLGARDWADVEVTEANVTQWSTSNLLPGLSYEFRVRASATDTSSPWSNIVVKQEDDLLYALARSLSPANRGIIYSPESLSWTDIPWVEEYDIYLGTDEDAVLNADPDTSFYLGRISGSSMDLTETLASGTKYFWRIDPVTEQGPETGSVYSFTVSDVGTDTTIIRGRTFSGHTNFLVEVQLSSKEPGESWRVSSSAPWLNFAKEAGTTPETLSLTFNSSDLAIGLHTTTVTLESGSNEVEIPVHFEVEPANITHIQSDRTSSLVYAISEASNGESAYLLEIDSETEAVERVLAVGSSVTDLAIHYEDNLIYVTNWQSGQLLAIDKTSFELVKTHQFQPAGLMGYSQGDVYRVAAGASERLVIEEQDQWINIDLYNTRGENVLSEANVRQGGGVFGPNGRYYYHGESNSSGASIIKFDTSGDSFTQLAEVRPAEIASYYGSRTVVISEDGSRLFWAGVVLDQELTTEWGLGETIYSTSENGRYAFSESAIYDVNLKRQVLAMPSSTSVSGYNSTSKKLIAPVNGQIKFFELQSPLSLPAPILNSANPDYHSVDLDWSDSSLEMGFVIQHKVLNSDTWLETTATQANVTQWTATGLEDGLTYEFRVQAVTPELSSPWSNTSIVTLPVDPNEKPQAQDDLIQMLAKESIRFSVTSNDSDVDGEIDPNSITIVSPPQFGELIVLGSGEIIYLPDESFESSDSFSYTVDDNESASSDPATVTLLYTQAPILSIEPVINGNTQLSWVGGAQQTGFVLQVRLPGYTDWSDLNYLEAGETSLPMELQAGQTYEFRIRENDVSSTTWSNVVSITIPENGGTNHSPIANDDTVTLATLAGQRYSLISNDLDEDDNLSPDSIVITTQPQLGAVTVHPDGAITYVPGSSFVQTDSFSYSISDEQGATSSPASVIIVYVPTPTLSISQIASNAVSLSWSINESLQTEFVVQQRVTGSNTWEDVAVTSTNVSTWRTSDVQEGVTYEFRIRSTSSDYSSPWSNIAIATVPKEEEPQDPAGESSEGSGGGSFGLFSLLLLALPLGRRKLSHIRQAA